MILRSVKIIAVCFLFLAVTGGAAYLTLTWIIESEDTVIVPDLVGKDVVYALELLTDLGLNTKVKGSRYSDTFAKNHVILQEPAPGVEIKKGRDVRVVLSKGERTLLMPNLAGLSIRQGRLVVEENGLCLGRITSVYYDAAVPEDQVIAQAPPKSELVERGQCVNLMISRGPRPLAYRMSSLEGLSIDEAAVLIERSHLHVGRISYLHRPGFRENLIVDQNPRPGHRIFEGAAVDLVVNRKPGASADSLSDRPSPSGLLMYKLPAGFLKKRIKVRMDSLGISSELFNDFMEPGQELWLLLPTHQTATLFIYEDDSLAETRIFGPP